MRMGKLTPLEFNSKQQAMAQTFLVHDLLSFKYFTTKYIGDNNFKNSGTIITARELVSNCPNLHSSQLLGLYKELP